MLKALARKIRRKKAREMDEIADVIARATTMRDKLEETMSIGLTGNSRGRERHLSVLVSAHAATSCSIAQAAIEFNLCSAVHAVAECMIDGNDAIIMTCEDTELLDQVIQELTTKNGHIGEILGFELASESDLPALGHGAHAIIVKTDDPRRLEHQLGDMMGASSTLDLQFAIIVPSFYPYDSMFFETLEL